MSTRKRTGIALGGAFVLLALHLDAWRPQRAELWFGWVPEELLWRWGWMGLAWLYLLWFAARVWTEAEDES